MPTRRIMTREVITLPPSTTVADALWIMHENQLRSAPVVDEEGCFLGLFGVRRLSRLLLPKVSEIGLGAFVDLGFLPDEEEVFSERLREAGNHPVSNYLEKKKKLIFCGPDTPFPELLRKLEDSKDTSLPVIIVEGKKQKLVGVVSSWDVLERLALAMLSQRDRSADSASDDASSPRASNER